MTKIIAELDLQDVLDRVLEGDTRYFYTDMNSVSIARLTQFAVHGLKCYCCGVVGDRVLITKDSGGGVHADVYAGLRMMNRDHIRPASLRGGNEIWNMRPACERCNSTRGNNYTKEDKALYEFNKKWAQWHNLIWCKKITKYGHTTRRILTTINRLTRCIPKRYQYRISKFVAKIFS